MDYTWWGWWLFWLLLVVVLFWAAVWVRMPNRFRERGPYGARGYDGGHRPGPYTGRGPRGYHRTDERIVEDINDRLTLSGEIDATDVSVECSDGEVTLSGTVDSRMERRTAEAIADSVPGVKDVHNELQIGRVQPADSTQAARGSH